MYEYTYISQALLLIILVNTSTTPKSMANNIMYKENTTSVAMYLDFDPQTPLSVKFNSATQHLAFRRRVIQQY